MGVGMLRDDLQSLPGVELAEIDGDVAAPAGVRIRLSPGVDPGEIDGEIRRVLALHGLHQETQAGHAPSFDRKAPEPPLPTAEAGDPETHLEAEDEAVVEVLESVSITDGRDGIVVTAAIRGASVTARAAGSSTTAIDHAVVWAVADLAGADSMPVVCSLDERELAGTEVVTVVLEESGQRVVGSAVVEGTRAYAVGRAVWIALSSR